MTADLESALTGAIDQAARQAGLVVKSAQAGSDYGGRPTANFQLALPGLFEGRRLQLELSDAFDFNRPDLLSEMTSHLREAALRLQNPRPDAYVTLGGIPISFNDFAWPFHHSTSGADTHVVHGTIRLEDGTDSPLHAKVSASMTLTFAEIVAAPEQPYAETFIYNAIRKTLDQGQLELIKSGNRQPVPVTTRYYSRWQKKFLFTETNSEERAEYVALKLFWLSGVLGGGKPVWIADPRDGQYLNTTSQDLKLTLQGLVEKGFAEISTEDDGFASATPKLMERRPEYELRLHRALEAIKPTFNEDMRHGHTNM